jgi:hypothetical protein
LKELRNLSRKRNNPSSKKGTSSKVIRDSLKYDAIPTSKAFDEIESIDIANKAMFLWYRKVMGV